VPAPPAGTIVREMSVVTAASARSGDARPQAIGLAASVLASVGWGFGAIFARLTSAPGLVLAFYRLWLGAALLTALVYVAGRRLSWDNLRASLLGGVFLAGDMAMFFCAVKLTSVVDCTVIGAVQPAIVLVAAGPLFGERMGRWDVVWVFVAMAGVSAAVIGPGVSGPHELAGDLLAVGSLLSWSAYWLVSKHARETEHALDYTAGVTIVAALTMTPIVLVSGQHLGRIEAGDWLWIALLAVVPGGAHLAMNWAHRYVDASVSSVIGSSNPIVAATAAVVILGQRLTIVQICCGLVALAAISVVAVRHRAPVASLLE
jgi:drug/metabolite transporter (DMT)-like permease